MLTKQVQELNFYKVGDRTHYNQLIENYTVEKCWQEVMSQSDFQNREQQVEQYNRENRWKKRGIAMAPVKFGIAFGAKFLNQVHYNNRYSGHTLLTMSLLF